MAPVSDREEMAKIARTIGLDSDEAPSIHVVSALFYVVLSPPSAAGAQGLEGACLAAGNPEDKPPPLIQILLGLLLQRVGERFSMLVERRKDQLSRIS